MMHSYHIFYFPFKWERLGSTDNLFENRVSLENIQLVPYSNWERSPAPANDDEKNEMYDERNYYFPFTHNVLYDNNTTNTIIKHFERKEPKIKGKQLFYKIVPKNQKVYTLRVDAINLNFYSTGVGVLSFYLCNELEEQSEFQDILNINQYGRRILPPFIADVDCRYEIAEYLSIEGLDSAKSYKEDFKHYKKEKEAWKPACLITNLIDDCVENISVTPVIDDRMFVNCWYAHADYSKKIKDDFDSFMMSDEWYRYSYVDSGYPTCQNKELKRELIKKSTYSRWQQYGTLYATTKYSLMALGDKGEFFRDINGKHMRTIYSRMMELVLVQRASMLKFSEEVTEVSSLSNKDRKQILERIGYLYKSYIKFVNQIYFRDVTAQDQGIELYESLINQFDSHNQIKDLDAEISELHEYFIILIDQKRNENGENLNKIAAIFLPATIFAGVFGMNAFTKDVFCVGDFFIQILIITGFTLITYLLLKIKNR